MPMAPALPAVDPTYLAMAAGQMEAQGRLFEPDQDVERRHEDGGGVIVNENGATKFDESLSKYGSINIPKQFLTKDKMGNIVERHPKYFEDKTVKHKFEADGSLSIWLNSSPEDLVM